MEDVTHDEISAVTNNNNSHGWQKVTYAKKRNNKQNKAAAPATISAVGSAEEKNGNVFRAIELHSEDRHRRIVEAQKKSSSELDDYMKPRNRGSKKRVDDADDSGASDFEVRENGGEGLEEETKKKKKKSEADKKPKVTVAEAAAKIDAENLAAFLLDISGTYGSQEDVQLMRFGDYFGRQFSGVGSEQFPWVKTFRESSVAKIADIPISHIPEAVYRTSADWISQRSVTALSSFALFLLDSILADLGNHLGSAKNGKKVSQQSSKSQVAAFAVMAIVLRRKPDVLWSILPTLRESSKYQGQDKLPVLVWMISQASQGDLAVGLCAWAHNLLPTLTSKSTNNPLNRDLILQLVERILAVPKVHSILVSGAVRKGERLIPPAELEILLRVTFPVSSARVKATERFEAVYPILKEVALAGVPGSKAMKQVSQQIFAFAIAAAGERNPELAKETTDIVLWSLNQNSDIYKHWDKIYLDNLEASVAILKKLSEHVKEQQVSQSSVEVMKQTLKSFLQKNDKALSEESGAQQALFKDADKYAKATMGRLSRGHGCLKAFVFTGIVVAAGATIVSSNADTFDWKSVTETVDWKSVTEALDWKRVTAMLSSHQSS